MVFTPNAPDGLFERVEKESEDTSLYKRIFLDYTYSIGMIYTAEEIKKSQAITFIRAGIQPQISWKDSNLFHTKDIEAAIEKGRIDVADIGSRNDKGASFRDIHRYIMNSH